MNVTPEMMYWLVISDNIREAAIVLAIISGIASIFAVPIVFIAEEYDRIFHKLICGFVVLVFFVALATTAFVQTSKGLAAIYVIPKIANSQTVNDLGEGVVTLAREWIEELRPAKKKGGAK